jgi:tRNA(Ile)-lysidine synthase
VEGLRALGYTEVDLLPVTVPLGEGQGLEAAAREVRYAALAEAARRRHATVLLGHTLDDQAETVLLGLARGSGIRSLAGMATRTGHLLRPLLSLPGDVTRQACAELDLEPWVDPHNQDRRFTRVRVRQTVLPVLEAELGPGVAAALSRTAELARDDADLLDRLAAQADPGTDDLAVDLLGELPPPLRRRLIRRWLARHGAPESGLAHVLAVEALVTAWHGQGPLQLPGLEVARVAGRLHPRVPGHS